MNLVFVVDSSYSVGRANWRITRDFLVEVVTRLDVQYNHVHVSVVTYSTYAWIQWTLGSRLAYTSSELQLQLQGLWYLGARTATSEALYQASLILSNNDARPK